MADAIDKVDRLAELYETGALTEAALDLHLYELIEETNAADVVGRLSSDVSRHLLQDALASRPEDMLIVQSVCRAAAAADPNASRAAEDDLYRRVRRGIRAVQMYAAGRASGGVEPATTEVREPVTCNDRSYAAVYRREGRWWAAYVDDQPGANTQGATLAEARVNLREALSLILEENDALRRGPSPEGAAEP
jgi:predicted RNase H-like HicB family nuclease